MDMARNALSAESARAWSAAIAADSAGDAARAWERSAAWARWHLESRGLAVLSGPYDAGGDAIAFDVLGRRWRAPKRVRVIPPPHALPVADAAAWHAERLGGHVMAETTGPDEFGPELF